MVDFINKEGDALRLYLAGAYAIYTAKFNDIKTIADFGCGTGGLLDFLKHNLPDKRFWGYDIEKKSVEYARSKGLDVQCQDITRYNIIYPDLIVMTEVLEHLSEPEEVLKNIPKDTWLVATVPCNETKDRHDPSHLHIWEGDTFFSMLSKAGFLIHIKDRAFIIQVAIARKI